MPDKDKPKPPPPPQALRTFLNLSAAVPPQYGVNPTKPLLRPYKPTPGQVRAQQGLMSLADLVRGLTVGATDEKDSTAAQMGELIQTGIPFLKSLGLGLGAIKGGLKIVGSGDDVARGLYSRVDEALKLIPAKGAHPNKVASLLKSNASAEELAYRQVPEFLAAKGNATVTPSELAAHLAAHPAPMPTVKTLQVQAPTELQTYLHSQGLRTTPSTPEGWQVFSDELERRAQTFQRQGNQAEASRLFRLSEQATEMTEALDLGRGMGPNQPEHAHYQVPGGENYRETIQQLPAERTWINGEPITADDLATPHGRAMADRVGSYRDPVFELPAGHFPNTRPVNVLVHTRANERTLPTGERGRFVEEVQSDWHQQGARSGYQQPVPATSNLTWNEYARANGIDPAEASQVFGDVTDPRFNEWFNSHQEAVDIANRNVKAVPDAPFKEAWPDLGLKQQVLEAANDPNAQWIGHTSGQTQAARYDLSKQVDGIVWHKNKDGTIALSAQKDGRDVFGKDVAPSALPDIIGKELADRIIKDPRDYAEFAGVDLQVGGEGMQHFYDRLLPKRLEKILKPFGGTVERAPLSTRTKAQIDAEMDALHARPWTNNTVDEMNRLQAERNAAPDAADTAAWIARLTPEMKERIRREGLPLLSLLGMGALWHAPTERQENRQ